MPPAVDFNSCRIVKRNQVQRMRTLGVDIRPRRILKFNIEYENNEFHLIDRTMQSDLFDERKNPKGRKIRSKKPDELMIYEHEENFNLYHPTLNDLDYKDPLDITMELSSGYTHKTDTLKITFLYFYFIDLEDEGMKRSQYEKELIDAILAYVAEDTDVDVNVFSHYTINIISNTIKISDDISKKVVPIINSTLGIKINYIPFYQMMLSPRTHVLSPDIKLANPETVELIKRELNYNESLFGSILFHDPLIVDHGFSLDENYVGKVIQIDKPDGFRYFRRIVRGQLPVEKIG
jgi:hypothetical protein